LINDRAQDRDHEKKLEEKRQEFEERKIHIETASECAHVVSIDEPS
jgi:hypothetical protein